MSDVRRVGVEEQDYGVYEVWVDPNGTHYLVPRWEYERWQRSRVKYAVGEENELFREQITAMQGEIERLRKELEETKRYWEECQIEHHKRNLECQRLKDSDLLAERRAEEILNYQADIERLRKVVDAVRAIIFESRVTIMGTIETQWAVVEALRELEES